MLNRALHEVVIIPLGLPIAVRTGCNDVLNEVQRSLVARAQPDTMPNQLQIIRVCTFLGEEQPHLTLSVAQIDKPVHEFFPQL